jgi:hypothetical protein
MGRHRVKFILIRGHASARGGGPFLGGEGLGPRVLRVAHAQGVG